MKTIDPAHYSTVLAGGRGIIIGWEEMTSDSVGAPQSRIEYKEKTVQILGLLVEGDLEGSNVPNPASDADWAVLLDDETQQPLTKPGLYHIKLNPLHIRPRVRKSDGPVTVIVVATP